MAKKVDRAARKGNVIPIRSGRLDTAALAQVLRTLAPPTRAADDLAIRAFLYVGPKPVRRSNERDEAYALRVRYHAARGIVRGLLSDLEALRPTAEGGKSIDRGALLGLLDAVEGASAKLLGRTKTKWEIIGAVREALQYRHRARRPDVDAWINVNAVPDVDAVRDYACERAPELAVVSSEEWKRAIDRWPGLPSKPVAWATVVYELLASADKRSGKKRQRLTDAKTYRAIAETWKSGNRKVTKPL